MPDEPPLAALCQRLLDSLGIDPASAADMRRLRAALDWVERKQANERDQRGHWFLALYGIGATVTGTILAWLIQHLALRL
jgi:hypothetical protein